MSETIVFTGRLSSAPRKVQIERATSLGYSISPTITKSTKYVVCGRSPGSKIDEAKKFGVTILNEQEWENLINQHEDNNLNPKSTSINKNDKKKRERSESSDDEYADTNDVSENLITYMVKKTKFWEIRLDGLKTYIRTGNIDGKGKVITDEYEHKGLADAKEFMTNLITKKTKQGFQKQNESPTIDVTKKDRLKRQKTNHVNNDDQLDNSENMNLNIDESIEENAEGSDTDEQKSSVASSSVPTVTDNSYKPTFKKTATLPSSITNAKPRSILKDNIPHLLLAHSWKEDDVDPTNWWISEKLDGVRAFWCGKRGVFLSRQGKVYVAPDWFTKDLPKDVDLDGELFSGRGKFQSTVSIVKAGVEAWKNITFQVFDVPSYSNAPFEDRMAYIEHLMEKHRPQYMHLVQQKRCNSVKEIFDELKRVETAGGEGLMIRKPKSEYENGRSKTLLKIKTFFDGEALVEGYEPGKNKYKGMTGALKCVMACGKKFKVGSGLSDNERKKPPKIGTIIVYRCQELSDSGLPRFPAFVGISADKTEPKDPDFEHKLKIK